MEARYPQNPLPSRILVAEDEPVIAETLALILRRSGFEVAVVHDGGAAVKQAQTWQPHAVVSDVVMPVMNGIEAAIQITRIVPGCRIVLMSGQASTADLQRDAARQGHFFEVLAKPVPPDELLERLKGLPSA